MLIPPTPPPLHPANAVAVVRLLLPIVPLDCALTRLKGRHRHPVTQRHSSSGKPGLQLLLGLSFKSTRRV